CPFRPRCAPVRDNTPEVPGYLPIPVLRTFPEEAPVPPSRLALAADASGNLGQAEETEDMNLPRPPSRTAVCTIVSKNYLAHARTLMDSVREAHPQWERYVLLVDEPNGFFDPAQERSRFVRLEELDLPDQQKFLYRYTLLEVNTAVKPWLLEWLFQA